MSAAPGRLLRRLVTHDVATGESTAYPDLRPLDVSLGIRSAFTAALAAARSMPGWTIALADESKGSIRAEARTPRLGFVDDVRIGVKPLADGRSRIHVRSASRIGIYDFGTNARRIREYLDRVGTRTSG
ncbi:MAG: DUF1499 domain-containing protein [Gemmatimonadota bacterium]